MSGRFSQITRGGKLIYRIDYRDCSVKEMIALLHELDERVSEHDGPFSALSLFNHSSFATGEYMREAERVTAKHLPRLQNLAIAGELSIAKQLILQGFNLNFQRNFRTFESEEAALGFLERQ